MSRYAWVSLFLLPVVLLFAGPLPRKDSLLLSVQPGVPDSARVQAFCDISGLHWVDSPDSALHYAREGLKIAERAGHKKSLALALRYTGIAYVLKGDNNLAIKFLNQALEAYQKMGDLVGSSIVLNNLGNLHLEKRDYDTALELFFKALRIRESIGDPKEISSTQNSIGQIYQERGDLDKALESYTKALQIHEFLENKGLITTSYINIGSVYEAQKNYEKASRYFKDAYKLAEEEGDIGSMARCQTHLGNISLATGQYTAAAQYLQSALATYRSINYEEGLFNSLLGLAKFHLKAGNPTQGEIFALEALQIGRKRRSPQKLSDVYSALHLISAARGDYAAAYKYHLNYTAYQDTLNSLYHSDFQFNARVLRQELEKEKTESNQLLEGYRSRINRILLWGGLLILMLGVTAFAFAYRSRSLKSRSTALLKKKHQEISIQQEALEKQAHRLSDLVAIKDKVFSIIAHDLRTPMQTLKGILELVENNMLSDEELRSLLSQVEKNVEQTSSLLDNLLIWSSTQMRGLKLRPEDFSVLQVAEESMAIYRSQAEKKRLFLVNEIPQNIRVFTDRESLKFVLRNLISNAIKYTPEGGSIRLSGFYEDGRTKIMVSDSGIGIPREVLERLFSKELKTTLGTSKERGFGLGLILCKDIIERNHGDIQVQSEPSQGSTFTISLPVQTSKTSVVPADEIERIA